MIWIDFRGGMMIQLANQNFHDKECADLFVDREPYSMLLILRVKS
jgi:hypothetical protein